jgi:hypothetical protein
MKRELTTILTLLTIGILGTPAAQALATFNFVKPNQSMKHGVIGFNVTRAIDKNPKQYRFTVEITSNNGKLRDDFSASLSIYHTTKQSVSLNGIRNTPCIGSEQSIICNFTVPIKDAQNPELVFSFSPDGNARTRYHMGSGLDNFYFPLKTAVNQ